jgi:ferric-dicitrate binding protein FerR (iron transport regulator)
MKPLPAGFEALCDRVISGEASDFEVAHFRDALSRSPELMDAYIEQMQVHSGLAGADFASRICGKRSRPREVLRGRSPLWWKVAAAAALLLAGAAAWREWAPAAFGTADGRLPIAASSVSPVRIVRQTGATGLDLPQALPGPLLLDEGTAVVRLASGVELTLLGPASLEVCDAMRVTLENGRLLANVPQWAAGFTVRAPGLEVWDLGTVFGVSALGGVSDVFVFKGSVQVNEDSGGGVGLCQAGEGVRALAGERPQLFAADWGEAQKLFAAVRGAAALSDAAAALKAAGQIADLWQARCAPKPPPGLVAGLSGSRPSAGVGTVPRTVRGRLGEASLPGISNHTTTAGAIVLSPEQKESEMNMTNTAAALAAAAVLGTACMAWASGNIDPAERFAWSENAGWINFAPADGGVNAAVTGLSGYAWGENIGWVKMAADNSTYQNTTKDDWGVFPFHRTLKGFAWSETVGWINFAPSHGGVSIGACGRFDGFAWSENVGWIHVRNASPEYGVRTTGSIAAGTIFSIR